MACNVCKAQRAFHISTVMHSIRLSLCIQPKLVKFFFVCQLESVNESCFSMRSSRVFDACIIVSHLSVLLETLAYIVHAVAGYTH